jgi:arsenite methyltransferase
MAVDLELIPKTKRPAGEPCCEPVVYHDVERDHAVRMAQIAKALGDPARLQIVDVLRKHAGKVCVCELVPLFDLSQPTVSHHLKVLRQAGIVGSEREGLWAYYDVIPDALKELIRMAELSDIRDTVRKRYAAAAKAGTHGAYDEARALEAEAGCCGSGSMLCSPADATGAFGGTLYDEATGQEVPEAALNASLGCGVPTAVADLHEGEVVLDLGSGGGADVLISARRVGPTGKAIGLDMTDEMLELARANAAEAGVENVEFLKGYLEDMPLADGSIDVVISNCVINLSGDKPQVIREAARVLRPGGRFAVSDVIADPDMDEQTRADMAAWTGCVAGALTEAEFRGTLQNAGFGEIEIHETHRAHQHAAAAMIRARKPTAAGCCEPRALANCCEPEHKADCCGEPSAGASSGCGCQP